MLPVTIMVFSSGTGLGHWTKPRSIQLHHKQYLLFVQNIHQYYFAHCLSVVRREQFSKNGEKKITSKSWRWEKVVKGLCIMCDGVVQENIHTLPPPPMEGSGNSEGEGVLKVEISEGWRGVTGSSFSRGWNMQEKILKWSIQSTKKYLHIYVLL